LTSAALRRISRGKSKGARMGWEAIGLIVLFVVAIAAINRIEFGRFD
jgi:hypothetical protein